MINKSQQSLQNLALDQPIKEQRVIQGFVPYKRQKTVQTDVNKSLDVSSLCSSVGNIPQRMSMTFPDRTESFSESSHLDVSSRMETNKPAKINPVKFIIPQEPILWRQLSEDENCCKRCINRLAKAKFQSHKRSHRSKVASRLPCDVGTKSILRKVKALLHQKLQESTELGSIQTDTTGD